ncbi:GBS Bsp-like repeat-containing protein, partial [Streptococcus parasanguinis]|uniref:GBS Bsp-like repeat-containing protein n=1 Tax=Streptococcus parasanguinis TaxID=1318 RepID=UPI00189B9332
MKKKDLIFYAGTAVLLAFSTHQVKADEQHASDQTPENTSAVVAKTTTSSETQNTVNEGVGVEKGVQTENTVATEAAPITPTISDNPSSEQVTSEKGATEHPAPAVVASRAPYGARARVVAARNESILTVDTEIIKQKPSVKLEVKNVKSGSYDVVVSNIQSPNGIREILLPSWTSKNGEDDVVWNQGIKQSDGTYTYTVKSSDHHNETGMYQTNV